MHKWLESFVLCLCQKVGVHDCPLEYVVRELATVAVLAPPLQAGEPHSEEHCGSIERNMIAPMSHSHSLFKVDNDAVFKMIETNDKHVKFKSCFAHLVIVCPVEAKLAKKGKVKGR